MFLSISRFLSLAMLLAVAATANAGLIIEVDDISLSAGGSGFVDVAIRSDGIDLLDAANYKFAITPLAGATSTLDFSMPQDFTEEFDPNYVFFGDNFGLFTNSQSPGMIVMSDLTFTGLGALLTPADRLLVRLDVEHSGVVSGASDDFDISLVAGPDTMFLEPGGFDIPVVAAISGTVSVAGTAVVPEPSGFLFAALTAVPLMVRRRKR